MILKDRTNRQIYITGDTISYDEVAEVERRFKRAGVATTVDMPR